MQTSIIAQDEAIDLCSRALKNPTHLFMYGFNGLGKTTLAFDFLRSYAKMHNLT
jgi:MoxR-like ATPase